MKSYQLARWVYSCARYLTGLNHQPHLWDSLLILNAEKTNHFQEDQLRAWDRWVLYVLLKSIYLVRLGTQWEIVDTHYYVDSEEIKGLVVAMERHGGSNGGWNAWLGYGCPKHSYTLVEQLLGACEGIERDFSAAIPALILSSMTVELDAPYLSISEIVD